MLCHTGWEAYLLDWMRERERVYVSPAVPKLFFPKVISPSNYNRAVVTMAVVWSQSRRYNPPLSPTTKVFNFLFCLVVKNINQSSEYSRH